MEAQAKLTKQERYRKGIDGLIRFSFDERRADLQWMVAQAAKPAFGAAWLKDKYYELLSKCEEFSAPFQLVFDLETIAAEIFPRGARKFAFLRDPIAEYFKTRLKDYEPQIKGLAAGEPFSMAGLLELLAAMDSRDGRSMVSLFLSQLAGGKIQKNLAARLDRSELEKLQQAADAASDLAAALQAALEGGTPDNLPASASGEAGPQEISDSFALYEDEEISADNPPASGEADFLSSGGDFLPASELPGESFAHPDSFETAESGLMGQSMFDSDEAEEHPESTSGDQELDLASNEVYQRFLNEQSLLVTDRKEQILQRSGQRSRIEDACRQREEEESVRLLAELHPAAFQAEHERLLSGLDPVQSPLGRIMAHLSEMYRKLNTPDMRAYVDYYTAQLEASGLFEEFPLIRERLINYRNSLVDQPPELLKQVHSALSNLAQTIPDHRKCVEAQIAFLHERLADETFQRVWPTIAVILQNIIAAELDALGQNTHPSFEARIEAESRGQQRPLPAILADVEPASSETIAQARSFLSRGVPVSNSDAAETILYTETSLSDFFRKDPDGAIRLSSEILNFPQYSLTERAAAMRVLEKQTLPGAQALFQFHSRAGYTGSMEEQKALPAFRTLSPSLFDAKMSGIELRRDQSKAVSRLHDFFSARDPLEKTRIFQEFAASPHIPDSIKSLFRKGASADLANRSLTDIGSSRLSPPDKLRLLRILRQMAAHRQWLSAALSQRLQSRIQFYQNIQKEDEALTASLQQGIEARADIAPKKALHSDSEQSLEIVRAIRALDAQENKEQIEELKAAIPQAFRESALETIEKDQLAADEEERQSLEEFHHHGFSDEFLQSLIENRLRAARWYARLPEHSRAELQKQAAMPGKAQTLLHQIQTDNAFKIALRHLKKPVDPAVFAEISARFPDPEYQEKLKPFQRLLPPQAVAAQSPQFVSETQKIPSANPLVSAGNSSIDPSFDRLLDAAILSGPDLPALPEAALDEEIKQHAPEPRRPVLEKAATDPAEKTHSHEPAHKPRHPAQEHTSHPPAGVDGIAASLARGFSSLFSKPAQAPRKSEEKHSAPKARDKKAGAKKAQQAAAVLMKSAGSYAKGEVYITEKDMKLLEAEMEKHPDSRRLMDDHAYIFKIDHPDPAQFQPPIFVLIPEMKALNHDPARKKNAMTKIEQAISTSPSKKKAHLQALLTFMERYKTR